MKAFALGILMSISLLGHSQDTIKVKLDLMQYETPIIVSPQQANYPPIYFYRSLERYKIIIPLDFKFRKNYFFYNEKKRTYKIYY